MPAIFVHLSDIHFGQERGAEVVVHDDVKARLIEDAARLVKSRAPGSATGIIVTGDIAYAGKREEYSRAAQWLDELAAAVGCVKTAVQVVPGNHDIDRDNISSGCKLMLDQIITHGEGKLDEFLANELDREVLYNRFSAYRPFAEGYDCPLDRSGGRASDRPIELAPGRILRFIGLNSALICSSKDERGRLLLGARQHVLPKAAGEELVVLCHHPLDWLQDSDDARRYIHSRARVFMSGHEHNPSLKVEQVKNGCDLMLLAAGATVPPKANEIYNYTYNLLVFDWDATSDGLKIEVVPRAWSPEDTDFESDDARLGGHKSGVVLRCSNFPEAAKPPAAAISDVHLPHKTPEQAPTVPTATHDGIHGGDAVNDKFPVILLRFFRDLSPSQRLAVLVELKALPDDWRDPLTHAIERRIVDSMAKAGRLPELEAAMNSVDDKSKQRPGSK